MNAEHDAESRWELRPSGCFVALGSDGLRLGLRRRGLDTSLIPYADLTHIEATNFGLWIATRKTTQVIRRGHFTHDRDPEELVQGIRWRLNDEPNGLEQLARMREVANLALAPYPRRATWALLVACVAVFGFAFMDPFILHAAKFVPPLVEAGEWWRIVTANLLHGVSLLPMHLIINMLCLAAFGLLVERPLGWLRTFLVFAASGLAAMAGSTIAGNREVLGASGVIAGLVGAVLWLELHEPERLPAWWRVPRRLFIAMIVLQGVLDQVLPFIAAAAHLGGFVGGYLVMPFASRGALSREPVSKEQRTVAIGVAALVLVSLLSVTQLVRRAPDAMAAHGRAVLTMDIGPSGLNDLAWLIVTESNPSEEGLLAAIELAQRAVQKTDRRDPNILDTLAEVLFVAGDDQGAVAVIEEAIMIVGPELYFHEQRRRFLGERARDDRPDPPTRWFIPLPQPEQVVPPMRLPPLEI